jgi:hypothetical protein
MATPQVAELGAEAARALTHGPLAVDGLLPVLVLLWSTDSRQSRELDTACRIYFEPAAGGASSPADAGLSLLSDPPTAASHVVYFVGSRPSGGSADAEMIDVLTNWTSRGTSGSRMLVLRPLHAGQPSHSDRVDLHGSGNGNGDCCTETRWIGSELQSMSSIFTPARAGGDVATGRAFSIEATVGAVIPAWLARQCALNVEKRRRQTSERLLESMEQLSELKFEYTRLMNASMKMVSGDAGHSGNQGRLAEQEYRIMVRQVCAAAVAWTPPDSTVVVVSKGDRELTRLEGRRAWHFPQTKDGIYAGHYPTDSNEAIRHLEELKSLGANYLVFPPSASWWLQYYGEFHRHLESNCHLVMRNEQDCSIYAMGIDGYLLALKMREGQLSRELEEHRLDASKWEQRNRFLKTIREHVPEGDAVLIASGGDEHLMRCGGWRAWHYPQDESGAYADSSLMEAAEAVAHLDSLRKRRKARYLMVPASRAQWLEQVGLASELRIRNAVVAEVEGVGVLYGLTPNLARTTASAAAVPDSAASSDAG